MNVHSDRYNCKICNKAYASASSLWNHNTKFHTNKKCIDKYDDKYKISKMISHDKSMISHKKIEEATYKCNYCTNTYKHFQSRWKHEQKCKKNLIVAENNLPQPNINQINSNNTNTNTNNINNGVIHNTNNIIINQLGNESVDSLPLNDILKILEDGNNMPITCVKKVNFNRKLPENHSFCTTTLEGKHFTRINHKTQKPEKINKIDFINQILDSSLKFIQNISLMIEFDENFRENIPDEYQDKLKQILNNQQKFHEPKNKKAFFNCINDMSYNFKDIILKTWELLQPQEEDDEIIENKNKLLKDDDEEILIDENFNYWSSSDEDN